MSECRELTAPNVRKCRELAAPSVNDCRELTVPNASVCRELAAPTANYTVVPTAPKYWPLAAALTAKCGRMPLRWLRARRCADRVK